jgi:hypothetical protein
MESGAAAFGAISETVVFLEQSASSESAARPGRAGRAAACIGCPARQRPSWGSAAGQRQGQAGSGSASGGSASRNA